MAKTNSSIFTPIRQSLLGQRFERLTVIAETNRRATSGSLYMVCRCDCGTVKEIQSSCLTRKTTKSCGCLKKERWHAQRTKHGKAGTREHRIWKAMNNRCSNPGNSMFPLYGARGITVCQRWRVSFKAFLNDMGLAPTDKHSIGRINNEKGYSPDNCRWETPVEQGRNTRRNRRYTHDGKSLTLKEWEEITGIHADALRYRINDAKWPISKALTTPSSKQHPGEESN